MEDGSPCSIARSLGVLGDRWTFLVLREAVCGVTRFADFRDALGVAPDVLTDRLTKLVDHGVVARCRYRDAGQRSRHEYVLTAAGTELLVVLGALQQWGDDHLPRPGGPTAERRQRHTGRSLHVAYVDDSGREVAVEDVQFVKTQAHPNRPSVAAHRSGGDTRSVRPQRRSSQETPLEDTYPSVGPTRAADSPAVTANSGVEHR